MIIPFFPNKYNEDKEFDLVQGSKLVIPIELTDDQNRLVAKDVVKFKTANFVALVSSIPVLVGMLLGVVVVSRKQDLSRKAFEAVTVTAEATCFEGRARIRIDAIARDLGYEVEALNQNEEKILGFDLLIPDTYQAKWIETQGEQLEQGTIEYLVKRNQEMVYRSVANYRAINCRSN